MRVKEFSPVFIESAPTILEPGRLYISMKYHTVLHLCACGCGEEIVTPLAPDQWQLFYDGEAISLSPSIGNYRLRCHSHYFIRGNKVVWMNGKQKEKCRNSKSRIRILKNLFSRES